MTFEEWFEEEFKPSFAYSNVDPMIYESAARRAWEAGYGEGVWDSDPAAHAETQK